MTLEKLVVIIQAETAQLEKAISRVKSQLNSLDRVASNIGSKLTKSFNRSASGMSRAFKAIGLGALTAGIISFGKSALDAASDLEEWQNVVDVAFGDAKDQANQLAEIAIKKFGISELAAKKMAGRFMAMADGVGLANAAGAKMAVQLTGLAADMASFYNTTTDVTSNALQAIFTGQARALKQFGVVMSEANLEAFRMARGIETAYSAMNEAQRVALRYNYVLSVTKDAQNDYARTAMSWANQMRLLHNNWTQLITQVGQGLMKVLVPVVAILNKILTMAIAIVNAIAKVFGGKGIASISSGTDALDGIGGAAEDNADAFDGATAAAKKYKATVAGFDELERLNGVDDSGSGLGGLGLGDGGIGVDDLDSYFDLYDEEGILNKFEEFMQRIKDLWDAGDFEGIGREIAGVFNTLMQMLDDWIVNKFEPWGIKWAEITARILNGVVEAFNFELLGKLIGDGLNAIIHICNTFLETFNALALGEGIGRTVNSWFNTVDWEGLGHYFANRLNFLIDIVAGFFDKFIQQAYENGQKIGEAFNAFFSWIHWDNLSRAIWEGLNSLGQTIQGFVDMVDWEDLKTRVGNALSDIFANLDIEGIKNAIADLVNSVMDFLLSVDWYQIGYTVGEMLSGVDWLGVLIDVKNKVIWPAIKGFWDGLMSDGKNLILGTVGKIKTWFEENFWGPFAAAILNFAKWNIIIGALRGFFSDGASHLITELGKSFGWVITDFAGLRSMFEAEWNQFWGIITGGFKSGGLTGALSELANLFGKEGLAGAIEAFSAKVGGLAAPIGIAVAAILSLTSSYGGLGGVLKRVVQVFGDTIKHVKDFANSIGFGEKVEALKNAFSKLVEPLKRVYEVLGMLKPVWEILFTTLTAVATTALNTIVGIISGLAEILAGLVDIVAGVIGLIVDIVTLNFENLVNDIHTIWEGIVLFFQGIWDAIINGIMGFVQGVIDWFKDLKYNLIGDPIVIDMLNGIVDAFVGMFKTILEKVQEWIENIINLWLELKARAEELFEAMRAKIQEIWEAVKANTEAIWNAILAWITALWENLKALTVAVWEFLKQTILAGWTWIKTTTASIWTAIKTLLSEIWENIKTLFNTALEALHTAITNAWNAIKETTSTIWNALKKTLSDIWDGIKNTAKTISDQIAGFWTSAYDKITGAWSKFKSFWSGVWSGAAGVVRSAINGVIGVINSFSITNPFTGQSWGFNVPYLAKGGVITSPTLAMMGEYSGAGTNPEIVAPQSLLKEIISSENGEMVDALYQIARQIISAIEDVDMSVSIGDDQIAQAANRGNNNYKKRTGKPLFSM